jgi:hypothetical protein
LLRNGLHGRNAFNRYRDGCNRYDLKSNPLNLTRFGGFFVVFFIAFTVMLHAA